MQLFWRLAVRYDPYSGQMKQQLVVVRRQRVTEPYG